MGADRDWNKPETPKFTVVVGTGFLIDREGHFITAAHVANIKQVGGANVRLTAGIRQKSGGGSGQSFNVVGTDEDHDLALCQVNEFRVFTPAQSPTAKSMRAADAKPLPSGTVRTDARHPFASLGIASNPPETGDLALVTGFPLGSWTPTVQLGLVAAVETLYPPPTPPLGVHKDSGHLLQISVSANHGNSGGPVIDLVTGKVIGVYCKLCLLRLHLAANYAGTSAPLNPRA